MASCGASHFVCNGRIFLSKKRVTLGSLSAIDVKPPTCCESQTRPFSSFLSTLKSSRYDSSSLLKNTVVCSSQLPRSPSNLSSRREFFSVLPSPGSANANVATTAAIASTNSSGSSWDFSEAVGASAAFLAMTTGGALALSDRETKQFHNITADDDRQDGLKGRAPKRKLANLRRRRASVTSYRARNSEKLLATSALTSVDPSYCPAAAASVVKNVDKKASVTMESNRKYEVRDTLFC